MRKYLFIALALVAGALAFTSCNKKDNNDPESSSLIKGIKFCCDLDRGQTPVREYLYFGLQDDFEWGMEIYEDQARTKKLSASGDYGTYVLNEEKSYIDMTFTGAFYEEDGEREYHAGQAAHKDGRFTYKFNGDTIYITAENGYTSKYWKK
jgi:hypothetical protein